MGLGGSQKTVGFVVPSASSTLYGDRRGRETEKIFSRKGRGVTEVVDTKILSVKGAWADHPQMAQGAGWGSKLTELIREVEEGGCSGFISTKGKSERWSNCQWESKGRKPKNDQYHINIEFLESDFAEGEGRKSQIGDSYPSANPAEEYWFPLKPMGTRGEGGTRKKTRGLTAGRSH